jgi:phosphohistidine phosphatase
MDGADPPLSEEGLARMQAEARGMTALGIAFDAVIASPLARARQTAGVVAGGSGPGVREVEIAPALSPGCRLRDLPGLFEGRDAARAILLVGHQPDLGRIVAELAGLPEPLPLSRGALCCLEVSGWPPRPPATIERLLDPEYLAKRGER